MIPSIWHLLSFGGPPAIGLLLLVLAASFAPSDTVELLLPVGPVRLVVDSSTGLFGRFIVGALGLIALASPAFRDYSALFPRRLVLHLFFDAAGLTDALSSFSLRDLERVGARASDWSSGHTAFIDRFNRLIAEHDLPSHIRISSATTGSGAVSLRFRHGAGWQRYLIEEATGEVGIDFEQRGQQNTLRVQFELVPSPHNLVRATLGDIYLRWTKVIRPSFRQYVQVAPLERFEVAHVVAMTKIRVFPVIGISPTVYFVGTDSEARTSELFPVGYAQYDPA